MGVDNVVIGFDIRDIPEDHNPLRERDIRFNRKWTNALENQYSQSILHKNNDLNGHPCEINCNSYIHD